MTTTGNDVNSIITDQTDLTTSCGCGDTAVVITANVTDFPTKGADLKISLRNSQYPQFDYAYAQALKDDYPDIWERGGNVRGNEAFTLWGRARDGAETTAVLDWIKEREAWAARHADNFRLAGVVAQIKWGVIGSRGMDYMKQVVSEAKKRLDNNETILPAEPNPNYDLITLAGKTGASVSDTAWVFVKPKGRIVDVLARDVQPKIALGDLHEHGLENDPHVTVLGFIDAKDPNRFINCTAVSNIVSETEPFDVRIVGLDLFENDEFDVLYFRVESTDLSVLHGRIRSETIHDWPHDEYQPHMTVAYLKPGEGRKYLEPTDLDGETFRVEFVNYQLPFSSFLDVPPAQDQSEITFVMPCGEQENLVEVNRELPSRIPTQNHNLINLTMTVNAAVVKRQNKYGREYLVVPYVGVVEGVMNRRLVLMEEIERAGMLWDDSAVVVDHPQDESGQHVSAKSPDVPHIGRVYNSTADGDKLRGELWIDTAVAKLTSEGQAALTRLERGETMEVSWGWWQVPEPTKGVFNGQEYDAISRNLIPDHLAILLNAPGACSVADGCGTYRANKSQSHLSNGCDCQAQTSPHMEVPMSDELEQVQGADADIESDVVEETTIEVEIDVEDTAVEPAPEAEAEQVGNSAEGDLAADGPSVSDLWKEVQKLRATVNTLQANAEQQAQQERQTLVGRLAANEAVPFDARELATFSDEQLKMFETKYRTADFAGRGGAVMNDQEAFVPLSVPAVLLAKVEATDG
jgi:2'-5' RNA ligase